MRFNETRAKAFAKYTLPALLTEQKAKDKYDIVLWMRRTELATILGMTNARKDHFDYVAAQAINEGIVSATATDWVYFVYDKDTEQFGRRVDTKDAAEVTEKFFKVFGSLAADEMLEEGTYREPKPEPKRKG